MRKTWLAAQILSAIALSGPACALEASDAMASWSAASADDKTKLVTEVLKRDKQESATPSVVRCLDAAADVPDHADLTIGEVIKACEKENGEPI